MICLFCKQDSADSRSVEHIIPESLGNSTFTLPPGVVCDGCNNYFARKVEKPLMELNDLTSLRFHQRVPNKKGKIPSLRGTVGPDAEVAVHPIASGPAAGSIEASPDAFELIFRYGANVINLPAPRDTWDETLTSRFLAKVALEAMAMRLVAYEEGLRYLATEPQFDPIREYARRGGRHPWPYHARRIYAADKRWNLASGEEVQRVWECEILHTEREEYYFVLALFGLELTINYAGPEIYGYLEWLDRHDNISPLYHGTHANDPDSGT